MSEVMGAEHGKTEAAEDAGGKQSWLPRTWPDTVVRLEGLLVSRRALLV